MPLSQVPCPLHGLAGSLTEPGHTLLQSSPYSDGRRHDKHDPDRPLNSQYSPQDPALHEHRPALHVPTPLHTTPAGDRGHRSTQLSPLKPYWHVSQTVPLKCPTASSSLHLHVPDTRSHSPWPEQPPFGPGHFTQEDDVCTVPHQH